MTWGLKKSIKELLSLRSVRYFKNDVVMDVKFEPDSENGWAVCGNDWMNALRGLEFKITRYELVRDGWARVQE